MMNTHLCRFHHSYHYQLRQSHRHRVRQVEGAVVGGDVGQRQRPPAAQGQLVRGEAGLLPPEDEGERGRAAGAGRRPSQLVARGEEVVRGEERAPPSKQEKCAGGEC